MYLASSPALSVYLSNLHQVSLQDIRVEHCTIDNLFSSIHQWRLGCKLHHAIRASPNSIMTSNQQSTTCDLFPAMRAFVESPLITVRVTDGSIRTPPPLVLAGQVRQVRHTTRLGVLRLYRELRYSAYLMSV